MMETDGRYDVIRIQSYSSYVAKCYDSRATCHIAECCHLANSLTCHSTTTCHIEGQA